MNTPRPTVVDVAVIGGGRAGFAAARAAVRSGCVVMLVDERPRAELGWRLACLESYGIDVRCHAVVFGVRREGDRWRVDGEVTDGGGSVAVLARSLVMATGSIERPLAFPGWTLPGVGFLDARGARAFSVDLPGQRVAVAGAGPWLADAVERVRSSGAEIAVVVDVCSRERAVRTAASARRGTGRREAMVWMRELARGRSIYRDGHAVVRAGGRERVEWLRIAPRDAAGRPRLGSAQSIDVDRVVLAFGRVPAIECLALAGVGSHWLSQRGGHVPVHGDDLRCETQGPAVFVAGDAAGLGSALVARLEGELAGLGAASTSGQEVPQARLAALMRASGRAREAADQLQRAVDLGRWPGLLQWMDEATIACRCERVMFGAVDRAVAEFGPELRAVKLVTRAGMGECQGRMCQRLLAQRVRSLTGRERAPDGGYEGLRTQFPARPATVEALIRSLPAP